MKPVMALVALVGFLAMHDLSAAEGVNHVGAKSAASGAYSKNMQYDPSEGPTGGGMVKLGVAQMQEVYWNLDETITKACQFIKAAGDNGVDLLTFSEGAISGYPWWNWWTHTYDLAANEKIQEMWVLNSPRIGHAEFQPFLDCIKAARVNVVLPINERDNQGSQAAVFNAAIFIDRDGVVIARHRKALPSFTERFWWTHGDGSDLVAVDMPGVGKVCALLCWENFVALARYTVYAQDCEFYVAPTQDIGSVWTAHLKAVAREAGVYVLSTGQMYEPRVAATSALATESTALGSQWTTAMLDACAVIPACNTTGYFMDGGSTIVSPTGLSLAGPVYSACAPFRGCEQHPNYLKYSTAWARSGCPGLDGGEPCGYIEVPGITQQTNYEEFILSAFASRDLLREMQDNKLWVGPSDVWKVTWYNRQGSYISPTQSVDEVRGSSAMYVDKPGFRDVPIFVPGAVGNGLYADDE